MLDIRAEEKTLTFKVSTKPGVVSAFSFPFKEGLPFCLKSIKWSYGIPPGVSDTYGWPKIPLQVTIDTICSQQTESPVVFTTPIVLRGVTGSVLNQAQLPVDLCLQFVGLLISGEFGHLTDHQIGAYASLDSSQRSMLALPLLMNSLNMASQEFVLGGPAETKSLPQLPDKKVNGEDQLSLLIGDLFQLSSSLKLPTDSLVSLAEALIKKGWAR